MLEQEEIRQGFKCDHLKQIFISKQGLTTHIGHKHNELKKPEVQSSEPSDKSLVMSEVSKDISLPLANFNINAEDEVVKRSYLKDLTCEGCSHNNPIICAKLSTKHWKNYEGLLCGGCKDHWENGKCYTLNCHCGKECPTSKNV